MEHYGHSVDMQAMGKAVLKLYQQAFRLGRLDAVDYRLSFMEELARVEPKCRALCEQAYLMIVPRAAKK